MKTIKLLSIILIYILMPINSFGQKAYEEVKYEGKLGKQKVVLNYGDGYLEATEIIFENENTGESKKYYFKSLEGDWDDPKGLRMKLGNNDFNSYILLPLADLEYYSTPTETNVIIIYCFNENKSFYASVKLYLQANKDD